jgi:hypothetical protein
MSERDEFFIGYLATPAGIRRWMAKVAVGLLVVVGAIGMGLAAMQRDPGEGIWDLSDGKVLEGVVEERPCPMVQVEGKNNEVASVLLVGEGKVGVAERVAGMEGKQVRVRGHTISRGVVRLFEMEDGAEGIVAIGEGGPVRQGVTGRRVVTMRGEIVDPKCFAGAMKPGEGKTHKGCAVLCLRGGIPAAFVGEDGTYLIVDEQGRALSGAALERVLPVVGEPVEASGEVELRGDLKLFHLSGGAVRRL